MGGIGVPELVIILLILLLLFGGRKLPGLASSIGTSLREFRKATDDAEGRDDDRGETGGDTSGPSSTADPDAER